MPSIEYEYSVGDKRYVGHRFSWRPLRERADEDHGPSPALSGILSGYSPGSAASVYYDPKHPEISFLLLNGTGRYLPLAQIGGLLLLIGILVVLKPAKPAKQAANRRLHAEPLWDHWTQKSAS